MSDTDKTTGRSEGEAIIRRALRRSLLTLALLLAIVAVGYLITRTPQDGAPVPEAAVQAPAARPAVAATQPPTVQFTDITDAAGVDFVHVNGAYGERLMPETIGSGAAFFDYDNDGDQDLFLANFRNWPDHPGDGTPTQALYRNDGSGRFENVSEAAGLAIESYGMGVAIGDYDGDGWRDLFPRPVPVVTEEKPPVPQPAGPLPGSHRQRRGGWSGRPVEQRCGLFRL